MDDNLKNLTKSQVDNNLKNLTKSQKEIYEKIFFNDNYINSDKKWISITGSPGTGKTFLIHLIHKELTRLQYPHYVIAPTNSTAKQIGGKTIHAIIKGGNNLIKCLKEISNDVFFSNFWSSQNPYNTINDEEFITRLESCIGRHDLPHCKNYITSTNAMFCQGTNPLVIIIDEIGLIPIYLFYYFLFLIPENTKLILFGDEHQIRPIDNITKSLYDLFPRINSELIENYILKENVRHESNKYFQQFIMDWFNDERSKEEIPHLKFGGSERDFFMLRYPKLVICGRNKMVKFYQDKLLLDFAGDKIILKPVIEIIPRNEIKSQSILDENRFDKYLNPILIKPHVPIMINANVNETITNNSLFKFLNYDEEKDKVELTFNESTKSSFYLGRCSVYVKKDDIFVYKIKQFPIDLFFAVTTHKVQGFTINYPILIKSSDFWMEEQYYVAVSRATKASLIYSDDSPILYPSTLQVYIQNVTKSLNDNLNNKKRCSMCNLNTDNLQLIEGTPTRRVSDESHNIFLICESCYRQRKN